MESGEIVELLKRRYSGFGASGVRRYLYGEEVGHGDRWADLIIQDTWRGGFAWGDGNNPRSYPRHGFEIKVSRSDWLNEIKDPSKAETFRPYCHYWSLVIADKTMVKDGELPNGWGLLVPKGNRIYTVIKAPENLEVLPMPSGMMTSFMRRIDQSGENRGEQKVLSPQTIVSVM